MTLTNENPYNDDRYAEATIDLQDAVVALWEAGASVESVRNELTNALDNAGLKEEISVL